MLTRPRRVLATVTATAVALAVAACGAASTDRASSSSPSMTSSSSDSRSANISAGDSARSTGAGVAEIPGAAPISSSEPMVAASGSAKPPVTGAGAALPSTTGRAAGTPDPDTAAVPRATPTSKPAAATASPPALVTAPRSGAAALAVTPADRTEAARIVAGLSTSEKAASVLMVEAADVIGTKMLTEQHFGGVILFAPGGVVNGTLKGTPAQVQAVTAALRRDAAADPTGAPPLIATDQEYGLVQRLKYGFTTFPRASDLGGIKNLAAAASLTERIAAAAAQEMLAVGVTVDFAPVFGVLPEDGGPSAIGQYGRSYGADPQRVSRLVAAAVNGYQRGGVVASLKHFPGLARIGADSHVTLPTLRATCADWNAHEAIPAKAGVDAGALMVMTAHMLFPAAGGAAEPASMSPHIVQKLLQGSGAQGCRGMNFTGVTVTDSMEMEPIAGHYSPGAAAVAALNAGEDLLLMSANPSKAVAGIVAAITSGKLPQQRLDAAATAVLALRLASARVQRPPLGVVNSAAHRALAKEAFAAVG